MLEPASSRRLLLVEKGLGLRRDLSGVLLRAGFEVEAHSDATAERRRQEIKALKIKQIRQEIDQWDETDDAKMKARIKAEADIEREAQRAIQAKREYERAREEELENMRREFQWRQLQRGK